MGIKYRIKRDTSRKPVDIHIHYLKNIDYIFGIITFKCRNIIPQLETSEHDRITRFFFFFFLNCSSGAIRKKKKKTSLFFRICLIVVVPSHRSESFFLKLSSITEVIDLACFQSHTEVFSVEKRPYECV